LERENKTRGDKKGTGMRIIVMETTGKRLSEGEYRKSESRGREKLRRKGGKQEMGRERNTKTEFSVKEAKKGRGNNKQTTVRCRSEMRAAERQRDRER
jgi:hypothetical protein